jgi:hypothetical protein
MDLEQMIDYIESTSAENVLALIEAEINAIERFKLRDVYFKALNKIQKHVDFPNDTWE